MKTILVYASRSSGGYHGLFLSLEREGRRRGWQFAWLAPDVGDLAGEGERFNRALSIIRPAGVVIGYCKTGITVVPSDLPQVWLDTGGAPPGQPLVRHDNASFGAAAASTLLGCGTDNFAVFGFSWLRWSIARERAFVGRIRSEKRRCRAIRLPYRVASFPHLALGNICEALGKLPRPVSVFAVSDSLAAIVLMAAGSLGWRCPDDIRLVGVDDDEILCMGSSTPISSVHPDWAEGGRLVAEALEAQFRGGRAPRVSIYGASGVTRRATTRDPYVRPRDARVKEALAFIEAEFTSAITPGDVVRRMGCSRRLAAMRFREETGRSITKTIAEKRLERAKVLLRRNRLDVKSVAEQCGFKTKSALRAAFKSAFGTSMRDWRRSEWKECNP